MNSKRNEVALNCFTGEFSKDYGESLQSNKQKEGVSQQEERKQQIMKRVVAAFCQDVDEESQKVKTTTDMLGKLPFSSLYSQQVYK